MRKSTVAIVAALSAAGVFGAPKSVTPCAWNGDPGCWQMKRHAEKMELVAKGGAEVVFVGDSITHFGEGKPQWKKYFSEGRMKALNLGTSADRTEHVLWRLENGELDGYRAKCVLLMIGTNNTGHRRFSEEPPIDTILGVKAVLDKIREKQPGAVVVLTAIFPRGATADDPLRRRNDVVNRELPKLCDGRQVFWCDFTDQFLDRDGALATEYFPDRLHPEQIGYEIWYAAVRPYIDYALSDGALPVPVNRFAAHATPGTSASALSRALSPVSRIGLKDWWLPRLLEKRTQVSECGGEIDLVLVGDSITHNWEKQGRDSLDELGKTYSVLDIGYSGDRIEHLLWRLENGELEGYRAKCFAMMIGTNNAGDKHTPPEDVAAGIRRALDIIAERQPDAKTILMPIFPRGDANDARRAANEKVNEIIKEYADGEKIVWLDFNSRFLDENGDTRWIMRDRLHPNAEGYRDVWLPAMLPVLKNVCGM